MLSINADVECHLVHQKRADAARAKDVDVSNCFKILGIAPRYDIDLDELNKAYISLQTRCHPDVSGDDNESMHVNHAYKILSDPIKRAEHLLEISGRWQHAGSEDIDDLFDDIEKLQEGTPLEQLEAKNRLKQHLNRIYDELRVLFSNDVDVKMICQKINKAKYVKKFLR